MPAVLVGLWLGLALLLVGLSATSESVVRWRWPAAVAIAAVLAAALLLTWSGHAEPLSRWRGELVFDQLSAMILPPLWTGMAAALIASLFMPTGRFEPAIAALSPASATAGILSASPLLMVGLMQAGALIILGGLLVHDEGLAGHPLLNIATSLKYVTLSVVSGACLLMALLLADFYSVNPDRAALTRIVSALFVVGFGLAVGAIPFYFHVPDIFDAAPTLATASLAGPLHCLAFVYLIRSAANGPWLLAGGRISDVLVVGALGGALVAALMAFGQRRLTRLLAFNALREAGWVAFGLASVTRAGWAGALTVLAVRCISQPLLLITAKLAKVRHGEIEVDKLGGLARLLPLTAFAWCAGAFACAGLPPTASFWGLAALYRAAGFSGGLAAAALLASVALAVWRLGYATYAMFWRPGPEPLDSTPEPVGLGALLAAVGFGLAFGGFIPRLLQAPVDQLLTGLPFLR